MQVCLRDVTGIENVQWIKNRTQEMRMTYEKLYFMTPCSVKHFQEKTIVAKH